MYGLAATYTDDLHLAILVATDAVNQRERVTGAFNRTARLYRLIIDLVRQPRQINLMRNDFEKSLFARLKIR